MYIYFNPYGTFFMNKSESYCVQSMIQSEQQKTTANFCMCGKKPVISADGCQNWWIFQKRRVTPDWHYSIRPQCSGTLTLHAICPPYRWKRAGRSWQTSGKANPKWHPAMFCTCQSSAVMVLSGLTSFHQKTWCLSLQQTDAKQLRAEYSQHTWSFKQWHWAITLHKWSSFRQLGHNWIKDAQYSNNIWLILHSVSFNMNGTWSCACTIEGFKNHVFTVCSI